MGIKRIVDTSFWTDGKVDDFTPEDKYFMLYLLTNPFSTQLGIYEISIKQAAFQLGYSMDAVRSLIDRFENKYDILIYSPETSEIAIKNSLRHSIVKGGFGVWDCLVKEIKKVKDKSLIEKIFSHVKTTENLNPTVSELIKDYEKGHTRFYKEWARAKADENEANENDNENENDNDNENENDNEITYLVTRHVTSQTTADDDANTVRTFCGRVKLSDNQIADLCEKLGLEDFNDYVDRLDKWLKSTNAKIDDHYSMILKWYKEDLPY